jgi:hypothetical protein
MLQTRPRKAPPAPVAASDAGDGTGLPGAEETAEGEEPNIVSLDQFRKK